MKIRLVSFICIACVLSSCASNTVNSKPNAEEYSHLIDTPVYIKRASETDLNTYTNELDQCIRASNIKANRSSKVGIGVGSIWAASGLYTIATASGVFAPFAVLVGTIGTIVGGSTIIVTNATEEFREYSSLENCLERQGHDVIFYDARKVKK